MQFKDVIGQSAIKQRLIQSVRENHVSHAQLFFGPAGSGKLPLALAYAQYILCPNRTETDSCGVCPTCQKMQKLVHPDLHFLVPTNTTKSVKSNPESDLFMEEWREFTLKNDGYFNDTDWYAFLDIENKQGYMSVRDAASLLRKLNMKSYEGEYKIAIIWMAEKMRVDTANKLLKLLEEPPEKTVFLLIAEDAEELLATIKSRTTLVKVPAIETSEVEKALMERLQCQPGQAHDAAMISEGNWLNACHSVQESEDRKYFFTTFQQWMRLCFRAAYSELIDFSNNIKTLGREKQKELLEYGLRIIRNSLLFNNNLAKIVMLPNDEKTFNSKFAPFVNPANLSQIAELFEEAMRQIERNGYAPLIFTDISFKMVGLLKKK
ncbi:MAG: DNA polymerase III subunit delta' [bacterium F082]|nr:MAG: DNA polymerase III subunit delta' [bacterium F082]KWW28962.1 MAG: DNA polymerase III subunit delta' [bacterium P201]